MDHSMSSSRLASNIIIFLLVAGALYAFFGSSSPFLGNYRRTDRRHTEANAELDSALRRASMPNKTVIITVINKAYVEKGFNVEGTTMLDLFLESFWLGVDTRPLLDHLLFVAVDQSAYERCKFRRLHCYRLETDGVDFRDDKVYMSEDFIKMMWRRTLFLVDVLKRGYNFIFTDMDVLWLRNPFAKLSPLKSVDLEISVDRFSGNFRPERNSINTGFYYIRSNRKTISLFEKWYSLKDNSTGKKEQDVLEAQIRAGLLRKLNLKARSLETKYFSGFCQDSKDITAVATMHANCCRDSKAKFIDLSAALCDWKRFKTALDEDPEAAAEIGKNFKWSTHINCKNSWKIGNRHL